MNMQGSFVPVLLVLAMFIVSARWLDDAAERAAERETVIKLSSVARTWRFDEQDALIELPTEELDDQAAPHPAVQEAQTLRAAGHIGAAVDRLEAALQQDEGLVPVRIALCRLHLARDQAARGLEALNHPSVADDVSAMFLQGLALTRLGKVDEAAQRYRAVVRTTPSHFEANYNLGLLLLEGRRPTEAIPVLQTASEAAGGRRKARALFALGSAYRRNRLHTQAEDAYLRAIEFAPDYLLPRVNLALLYGTDKREQAEAVLDEALRLRPDFAPAYFLKARLASRANEPERALRLYERAAKLDPGFYKARYNIGILRLEAGRMAAAQSAFEALTLSFPDRPEPWFNLGRIAYRRDDLELARAHYEQALTASAGDYPEATLNLALVDRRQKKLKKALARLNRLLQQHGDYAAAYVNRGTVHQRRGDLDKAIEDFHTALTLQPKSVSATYNLARAHAAAGHQDLAVETYRAVLALRPSHERAAVNLGITLVDAGDLDGAEAVFRQALDAHPHAVKANFHLGRLELKTGRTAAALEHLQAVLAVDPDHITARRLMGLGYARLDRYPEAIEAYEATLERKPSLRSVRYNLALAHKRQGAVDKADRELTRCLRLDADYAPCLLSKALLAVEAGAPDRALAVLEGRVDDHSAAGLQAVYARALADQGHADRARVWLRLAEAQDPDDEDVRAALASLNPE